MSGDSGTTIEMTGLIKLYRQFPLKAFRKYGLESLILPRRIREWEGEYPHEPKEGEEKGEVHEDWGFFSYDSDREKIVFRQFLSEGFVNTYVLEPIEPGGKKLIFNSESTEGAGGMRARLTIELLNENEYRMSLDLASPGKDFFNCQTISMSRVK